MKNSINKVVILGNLGRAPELRYTPSGKAVVTLSVATSSRRKNQRTSEWEDETQWHRVTVLGDAGEWAAQKLDKGRTVYIEGALRYGAFENQQGARIPTVEIFATHVESFGAKKSQAGEGAESAKENALAQMPAQEAVIDKWVAEYEQG